RYYLDTLTLQLMCVGNGNPDAPIRIASNVEQFQVQYALPQMNPGGADGVDYGGTGVNVFSRDCAGNPTDMSDGRMRRAHRFVMTVRNAVRSAVALP
ncbi:MAG: hypothetical protein NTW15_03990, partial [Burkholderiales bacterium]|nr:hypothetical protein [Burkholderiales bacterium]